jgi:hypothetical protein
VIRHAERKLNAQGWLYHLPARRNGMWQRARWRTKMPELSGAVSQRPGIPLRVRFCIIGAAQTSKISRNGNTKQFIPPTAQAIMK